ncbi:MAG: energy transducer TonB [Caulobacteraceae bacterium]|nr:energy transducer TonB [Caulobacteraceae bacterium]
MRKAALLPAAFALAWAGVVQAQTAEPRIVTPSFTREPAPWYPEAARSAGRRGAATIDCVRQPDRTLTSCAYVSETRRRLNFREAARRMADVKVMVVADPPPAGSPEPDRVRLTVHFDYPRIW